MSAALVLTALLALAPQDGLDSAAEWGVSADDIIDRLIATTPAKEDELTNDARFQKIFAS